MKTQDIIVLRRLREDRQGRQRAEFYTGEIRPQTFGSPIAATSGVAGAKAYANEAEATRDLLAEPDVLRGFEVATVGLWMPQAGETVVYMARSNISGMIANVRLAEVLKVTKRGYVHLKRVTEPFNRSEPDLFIQSGRSNFITTIRPASEADLSELPAFNDMRRAQAVGREWTSREREERNARG